MVLEEINGNIQKSNLKDVEIENYFTLESILNYTYNSYTSYREKSAQLAKVAVLSLVKDAQQQHGLRHGDYQRYRGYCSRRIRRLRKVLKLPQGDRRHFKRRDVTDVHISNPAATERFLHVPLILAERSWAYAMQLRQESNTEPRKKFHMIRKLRKACTYALQLEELCKIERCDARTKLEAQAYVAWIYGTLNFELQLWTSAAENLKKAQVVYEKLASALPEEKQLPYKQRIEELTPSLRYCAYNIGDDKAINLPELRTLGILENFDKFILQSKEKAESILHEVNWYGVKVPVRNERVQLFLQSIINIDELLTQAENDAKCIEILENMFMDLRDVISIARSEVRSENKDSQLLLSYLISIRIERTVQRNMYLIKQTRKPQDIVRLLDIINQQMNELSQLEPLQNNEDIQENFSQRLLAYRTLRCYYLAKSHAALHRWAEAFGCFQRSLKYANEAISNNLSTELTDMIKMIIEEVPSDLVLMQSHSILEQHEDETVPIVHNKGQKNKKPLIERLNEFHDNPQYLTRNPNIVPLPPAMEPVPAKPLFYDLALNFSACPSLEDKLEEGQNKQKQASGISGFVKGIWSGWGSKK